MNRKYLIPVVASLVVLMMLASSAMPVMAVISRPTIGPKLEVTTIPQDDQKREKGIIILGLETLVGVTDKECDNEYTDVDDDNADDLPDCGLQDLLSQHKLLVTYNGRPLVWRIGESPLVVSCNLLEKDKVNPVDDKFGDPTRQFDEENLKTNLIDVTDHFICKPRWKQPDSMPGYEESVGVYDIYYNGPYIGTMLADHILVVEVALTIGRTVVFGADIQDICVLGWPDDDQRRLITLPNGGEVYYTWANPMGDYVSCEELALIQRDLLGISILGVEN